MTLSDKVLYHQIHPLKLLTDCAAGFGSIYPLWHHQLGVALAIMLVPPPLISLVLIRFADLDAYQQSPFGRYVARWMSRAMEATRRVGMIIIAVAAWYHSFPAIVAGCIVVLLAWFRGTFSSASR